LALLRIASNNGDSSIFHASGVFAEPFPGNGCLCRLHNSGFQQTCHNMILLSRLWKSQDLKFEVFEAGLTQKVDLGNYQDVKTHL
jgi:hypothetical protein